MAAKDKLLAALWMAGALLSFSLMAIGARELSNQMPTAQLLSFRSAIGLTIISVILLIKKQALHTQRMPLQIVRNVFHFGGQYGWFLGLGLLPLAEVFALEFSVPFWTLLIAITCLGERLTFVKTAAIVLGLIGVLIIVQPAAGSIDNATLIVLLSAVCYAISHSATKVLALADTPLLILFYMCLVQLPLTLLLADTDWHWPASELWPWILIIGITALSAHFCMASAMRHAEVTLVVTLDFLRLPLIGLIGLLFYQETFALSLLVGSALIMSGNLLNVCKGQPPRR